MTDTDTKLHPPKDMLLQIQQQFISRSKLGHEDDQLSFFVGAMTAMTALGYELPVSWTLNLMSGRPIVEDL